MFAFFLSEILLLIQDLEDSWIVAILGFRFLKDSRKEIPWLCLLKLLAYALSNLAKCVANDLK